MYVNLRYEGFAAKYSLIIAEPHTRDFSHELGDILPRYYCKFKLHMVY